MNTIPTKIKQLEDSEYAYDFSFVLPKSRWIEEYYNPLEENLTDMEKKYVANPGALEVVEMIRQEIGFIMVMLMITFPARFGRNDHNTFIRGHPVC